MNALPTDPPDDPQDHFCKEACKRLGAGEVSQMDVDDLNEVVRWLNEKIYYRVNPYILPAELF